MIQHRNARILLEHWRARRNGAAPDRSQIDPTALKPALANIFILERADRAYMPFRLAGSALCDMFGKELRAQNFFDLWCDDAKRQVQNRISEMLGAVAPMALIAKAERMDSASAHIEWVFAPVRSARGPLDRVIGCAHAISGPTVENPWDTRPFVRQNLFAVAPARTGETLYYAPDTADFKYDASAGERPLFDVVTSAG
ncbi:MAG: PAS domain-containing protein [Pseudomonadota bacterium]